jgi:hypothetical protein
MTATARSILPGRLTAPLFSLFELGVGVGLELELELGLGMALGTGLGWELFKTSVLTLVLPVATIPLTLSAVSILGPTFQKSTRIKVGFPPHWISHC